MAAQTRTRADEAYLNLMRVHEKLHTQFAELFRANGLTHAKYNVLRILRGAGAEGACCNAIGERLINREPDVTRLIDRMVHLGLVKRERSEQDRRVVQVLLTPKGRELCDRLDEPVERLHAQQFEGLTTDQLREFSDALQRVLET